MRKWWKGPINPIFLTIRNKELSAAFNQKMRKETQTRLAKFLIFLWAYYIYIVIDSSTGDFHEQYGRLMLVGEMTVTATVVYFLSLWKLFFVDTYMLVGCVSRFTVLVLLFSLIKDQKPGYTAMDPKGLHDAVEDVGLPALILFTTNWKLQLLLAAPIMMIS